MDGEDRPKSRLITISSKHYIIATKVYRCRTGLKGLIVCTYIVQSLKPNFRQSKPFASSIIKRKRLQYESTVQ